MLERHHLAIIHAVDKHGTLTEAANALHLTQSALSHGIKKLEVHLGAPVWPKRRSPLTFNSSRAGVAQFGQPGVTAIRTQ